MPLAGSIKDLLTEDSDLESQISEIPHDSASQVDILLKSSACEELEIKSDVEYVCSDIAHRVDALYRLSMLIRNPATPDKTHKTHKYAAIEVSHFEQYERERITYKYGAKLETDGSKLETDEAWDLSVRPTKPKENCGRPLTSRLPQFLVERLVLANLKRRQILAYANKHQAKIAANNKASKQGSSKPMGRAALSIAPTSAILSETTATAFQAINIPTGVVNCQAPNDTLGVPSAMSEDGASQPSSMAASVVSSEVGGSGEFHINIPLPLGKGKLFAGKPTYFECPFCFQILRLKSRKQWRWVQSYLHCGKTRPPIMTNRNGGHRRHVLYDIQPYMCTFEDCPLASQLFTKRSEWYKHELQFHRREWLCCKESCSQTFTSPGPLVQHLRTHPEHMYQEEAPKDIGCEPSQLLLLQCERESTAEQACPFCSVTLTLNLLKSHLSRHLIDFALFSLPQQHDEDTEVQPPSDSGGNRSKPAAVGAKHSHASANSQLDDLDALQNRKWHYTDCGGNSVEFGEQLEAIHTEHFKAFDTRHIENKFPNCPQYLWERLGEANTRRRQLFQFYGNNHRGIIRDPIEAIGNNSDVVEREAGSILVEGEAGSIVVEREAGSIGVERQTGSIVEGLHQGSWTFSYYLRSQF